MTRYVVFQRTDEAPGRVGILEVWGIVTRVEAHSAEHAIRTHTSNAETSSGVFAAVPERSWQPLALAVETTRRTRLSPPSAGEAVPE